MDKRLQEFKKNMINDYVDSRQAVWKSNLDHVGYESTMGVEEYQDELKRLENRKNVTSEGLELVDLKIDFENLRMRGDTKSNVFDNYDKGVKPASLSREDSSISGGSVGNVPQKPQK